MYRKYIRSSIEKEVTKARTITKMICELEIRD